MNNPEMKLEFEEIDITVSDLLSLKPFQDQHADGTPSVNEKRALDYARRPELLDMLRSVTNPISLTYEYRIFQGNHRRVAALLRQNLAEPLDLKAVVRVRRLKTQVSDEVISRIAYSANHGNAKDNYRAHLFNSKMDISVKVMKPMFDAVKGSNKGLSKAQAEQIAQRLGAIFNRNPLLVQMIKTSETEFPVTVRDFITIRTFPEATDKFNTAEALVDLRPYVKDLISVFALASDIVVKVTSDGTLKDKGYKSSGRSTLLYLIYSWALQGHFSRGSRSKGKLTAAKFITAIRNKSTVVKNNLAQIYSNPEKAEDSIKCAVIDETGVELQSAA